MIIIIINKYYYSVVESKKLQEHLTTEKNKTNDSVTQVKNRSQTARDQTSGRRAVSSAERVASEHCIRWFRVYITDVDKGGGSPPPMVGQKRLFC